MLAFMAAMVVIGIRWLVAIPATIVENAGVRESLRRSWRLTGPSWKRLFWLMVLLQAPFELASLALGGLAGLGADSPARSFAEWGVLTIGRTMAAAILSSVCYAYLRNAGSQPAPAPAPPAVP
ncbi:MAG: glycerophosphoryl diester phosphodiesterase membrane domain-containing protein [Acidobacteria bacterium]|nr:glycerophosphoryl diester phosphodiesterase membrane domain-containing protein [Acidobacteriota bacterium]